MKLAIRIKEGGDIPLFYGVAWDDWMRRESVCYPLGLNILVCLARQVNGWLIGGYLSPSMQCRDWYAQGYEAGKAAAKDAK